MKTIVSDPGVSPENTVDGDTRALCLTAIFVIAVVAFTLHFTVVHVPLLGAELEQYLRDHTVSQPTFTRETVASSHAHSALLRGILPALWRASGEKAFALRRFALLLHVLTALLAFQVIRLWLNKPGSVGFPLLGGLLVAVSPASVQVMTDFGGLPLLLASTFLLAACVFFLKSAATSSGWRYVYLMLSAWCGAAAMAAHYGMVVAPLVIFLADLLRVRRGSAARSAMDWIAHLLMLATALAVFTVLLAGGSAIAFVVTFPIYALSLPVILCVCRFIGAFREGMPRNALALLLALLLPVGAVASFRQMLRAVDPIPYLQEERASEPLLRRELTLRLYKMAVLHGEPEGRHALMQQVCALWPGEDIYAEPQAWERILVGRALMETGALERAEEELSAAVAQDPLGPAGRQAARMKAALLEEASFPDEIAALLAYVARDDILSEEESFRYGRALLGLGDITGAATTFAALPEHPEDTPEGVLQRQIFAAAAAINSLRDAHRQRVAENPADMAGYLLLAESDLVTGAYLRSFYVLEMALRRDPNLKDAWELLGVVFAKQDQPEKFIERWGHLRAPTSADWFNLARHTAHGQSLDSAYVYSKQYRADTGVSPEEYVGIFAAEMHRFPQAEHWFMKAADAHPNAYSPRLLLADLALAAGNPEQAQSFLEEARRLDAPEEELAKRFSALEEASPPTGPTPDEFEPVRTYIQ